MKKDRKLGVKSKATLKVTRSLFTVQPKRLDESTLHVSESPRIIKVQPVFRKRREEREIEGDRISSRRLLLEEVAGRY